MRNARHNALAAAIDALGAVAVAPGKVAFKSNARWYIARTDRVFYCNDCGEPYPTTNDGGSRPQCPQCYHGQGLPLPSEYGAMPAWWSPQHRFAWRHGSQCKPGPRITLATNLEPTCERITVSLETGQEVPA